MSNIVQIDPKEFGLEESKASEIAAQFKPMLDKMVELEKEYNEIIALPIDQDAVVKAKALRLKYVKVRTGTAEIHKKQKEFYLSGGRFVDGWKNAQLFASQGIEDKLESIEKHYENLEKERIANLRAEREAIAIPFGVDVNTVSLGLMTEEVWNNFIAGAKQSYEIKVAAEKKAEEDRLEQERKERVYRDRLNEIAPLRQFMEEGEGITIESSDEDCSVLFHSLLQRKANYEAEQERIRIENERLKKEAEAKQAELDKAKAESDRIQKEADAKAEAARKEADRIANEKIAAAKAESDRIAAELKAKQDEEDRKAKEAADAEKARLTAEKKAAAAPDKTKLLAFAELISKLETPEMKSEEGKAILEQTKGLIVKLTAFITDKANQI
jgi:colicin import membrane protein